MTVYATLAEFGDRFPQITDYTDETILSSVLLASSRAVDAYCGRRFHADTSATARVYRADHPAYVTVDDIATTSGLVVKADTGDTGTYDQTWTITTDFVLEPANGKSGGLEGLPYTKIAAVGARSFPTIGQRPRVQVTAVWGWTAIPEAITEATILKAAQLYRRKDSPDGVVGGGDFGVIRISRFEDPHVAALLGPYRTAGGAGLVVA
jgi:hypothetical protein